MDKELIPIIYLAVAACIFIFWLIISPKDEDNPMDDGSYYFWMIVISAMWILAIIIFPIMIWKDKKNTNQTPKP